MRLSPPGTHFTAESTEAMQIKSLAQGENILMLRFEPATFESKIDIPTTSPIVHLQLQLQMSAPPDKISKLLNFMHSCICDVKACVTVNIALSCIKMFF